MHNDITGADCNSPSSQPVLILPPIPVDDPLLLSDWQLAKLRPRAVTFGIHCRTKHVSPIAFCHPDRIFQLLQISTRQFQDGKIDTWPPSFRSLNSVFIDYRHNRIEFFF
jgi:hypothetical protein